MAIFGPKPWFEKMSIFRLSELLLCIPYQGVFPFQSMVKGIFLAYVTQKKEFEKWPFFDQNHGFTPLDKRSIFRLLELLVFIAQKEIFSFQNIVEDIFLPYIAKKKNMEKWPFLDQSHGLIPLEKCQIFDFLNFLFLQPKKAFFRSRIS